MLRPWAIFIERGEIYYTMMCNAMLDGQTADIQQQWKKCRSVKKITPGAPTTSLVGRSFCQSRSSSQAVGPRSHYPNLRPLETQGGQIIFLLEMQHGAQLWINCQFLEIARKLIPSLQKVETSKNAPQAVPYPLPNSSKRLMHHQKTKLTDWKCFETPRPQVKHIWTCWYFRNLKTISQVFTLSYKL